MQRYFIKNKDMLLEESDIRHIKKVMRMNINDKIEVVYNNKLHICEITSLEPFNIKVIEKLDEDKTLQVTVLDDLRKSYGLKFKDAKLKKNYNNYIKEAIKQAEESKSNSSSQS